MIDDWEENKYDYWQYPFTHDNIVIVGILSIITHVEHAINHANAIQRTASSLFTSSSSTSAAQKHVSLGCKLYEITMHLNAGNKVPSGFDMSNNAPHVSMLSI